MLIEQALMTYLIGQSAVTDLVGTRIYYSYAKQQDVTVPYIIFSKVDGPRSKSHETSSHHSNPRFQVSIFSTKYMEAKTIAAAVQGVLQGYKGTMGGGSGVAVGAVTYEDENDFYEEGMNLYHVACDYIIWHYE